MVTVGYRLTPCVTTIAKPFLISNKKFDVMNHKNSSLDIQILLEQKKVLAIVNGTQEELDATGTTECEMWKRPHGIT
jgi:hypothetical protein